MSTLVGCGGGGGSNAGAPQPMDTTPPTLTTISPSMNAIDVARSTTVELTFSEPVTAAEGAVTLNGPNAAVESSIAVSDSKITVTPDRPLGFGAQHTVSVDGRVRDEAGNAYAGTTTSFTTIPRNPAIALGGQLMDTYVRRRWSDPASNPWNSLPDLVDNGFEFVRVGVTTNNLPELRATDDWHLIPYRNEFWSSLEVSGALLREAADFGMRLHAMLFLSDGAAHAGTQPRPSKWAGLSEAEVADQLEQHGAELANYFASLGLDIEVFEIGNEIDFGVCGVRLVDTVPVPPGVDPVNDPIWMRDNVWVLGAPLLKAAIRGVLSVYPNARILLHIAGFGYSNNNIAATGFFQSMTDLGVRFDVAGLSFPYMHGGTVVPQPYFEDPAFLNTLDQIATFGAPLQIVEVAYPADPVGASQTPSLRYPFTPDGQADFVRDFAAAVRGRVEAFHYFYPDYYPGFDPQLPELENGGLFTQPGMGRPALAVFNAIAEGRLLA